MKYFVPVLVVWMVGMSSGITAAAPPPVLDIPVSALESRLAPRHIEQIKARVKYWLDLLVNADNEKAVRSACSAIQKDYHKYSGFEYRLETARETSKSVEGIFKTGLKANDPFKNLKEVNLGIIVSRMPQVTIQPALEVMVRQPNPAVRYVGWQGYRAARSLLLAQGGQHGRTMFETSGAMAAQEASPCVIGGIMQLLNIPAGAVGVRPDDLARAHETSFGILKKHWDRWCRRVLRGNAEMPEAVNRGINALRNYADIFAGNESRRKDILQMLADMMWCSGKAYDRAGGKGPHADLNVLLLLNCERSVNAVTRVRSKWIRSALTNPETPDRGAAVRMAVLKWTAELAKYGVKKPDFKAPSTAPVNTTTETPATAPS